MNQIFRSAAIRILSPRSLGRLMSLAKRCLPGKCRRPAPKRYERMVAGQHIDFEEVERLVSPGDGTVIDVGAERGEVSRFFLELGFDVVAVEPEGSNFTSLRRIRNRRFRALNVACSDHSTTGVLDVRPGTYFHTLSVDGTVEGTAQTVSILPLGEIITSCDIQKVSVLKVDAEGFDEAVLKGLFATSNILPKVVVVEFTRDTLRPLMGILRDRYPYTRFVCRWNELSGLCSQVRVAIIDGENALVYDALWGNIIASTVPFRVAYPLEKTDAIQSAGKIGG